MRQVSFFQEYWEDDDVQSLSSYAMCFGVFCLTNPNSRLIPAFKLSDKHILFWFKCKSTELPKLKKEVEKIGIYFLEGFCVLKTRFQTYHKFKGGDLEKAKSNQMEDLPESVRQLMISDTLPTGSQDPLDTPSNSNSNNNSNNSHKESNIDIESTSTLEEQKKESYKKSLEYAESKEHFDLIKQRYSGYVITDDYLKFTLQRVLNWAESKGKVIKSYPAQIRTFIDFDIEKGKLEEQQSFKNNMLN